MIIVTFDISNQTFRKYTLAEWRAQIAEWRSEFDEFEGDDLDDLLEYIFGDDLYYAKFKEEGLLA